jgi:hypothetical protein
MTKVWGPLGWGTLHSIAALYPDTPTALEREMIARWFDSFANTLACSTCMKHFKKMFADYIATYPQWNASRLELTLFVLRAHNTVNARQSYTVHSVDDAFKLLRTNIDPQKAEAIRQSYIMYIRKDWARDTTMSGISSVKYIKDLLLVETEYWSKRSFVWDDVYNLIGNNMIDPLDPSKLVSKPATGISLNQTQFSLFKTTNGPKPRFSFLSR